MENLKLISLRIDERDADAVERIANVRTYTRASDIYRAGIRLAAYLAGHGQLDKLLGFFPRNGDVVDEFEFKYHRTFR